MTSFRNVVQQPFTVLPDGRRVLQCHSRGDRRFTPFNCFLEAFGRTDSIENHYHRAKVFVGEIAPSNWREAKRLNTREFAKSAGKLDHFACRANQTTGGPVF